MHGTSTSPPKVRYAVSKGNIIKLIQPGKVDDQLTEILRSGARALLAQADSNGCQRDRNGRKCLLRIWIT